MFYVLFNDEGRLHVSNKEFDSLNNALKYADSVAQSRKPRIVELVCYSDRSRPKKRGIDGHGITGQE